MRLRQQIDADIKTAMLAREKDKLRALRAIKSMILLAETERGGAEGISEEAEIKLLTKAVKQRKNAYQLYKEQGREDLAEVEKQELDIISTYLPQQLSEDEIRAKLEKIIAQVGAAGSQDMAKVMGVAARTLAGKADGKLMSTLAKSLLKS